MDIGRVVPMVGHTFGNRHMSAECDLDAVAPVAEIRETDDCLFGEAHQAAQDFSVFCIAWMVWLKTITSKL